MRIFHAAILRACAAKTRARIAMPRRGTTRSRACKFVAAGVLRDKVKKNAMNPHFSDGFC
jgi:hypothetical protein